MVRRLPSVLLALVLVACSSGSDDGSAPATTESAPATPSTSPTSPATSSPTTAPATTEAPTTTSAPATTGPETAAPSGTGPLSEQEQADRDLAETALLTLADFPDGWSEEPPADDGDDEATAAFEEDFDACLERDDTDQVGDRLERVEAVTGDFTPAPDSTTEVSHQVSLAEDEATAIQRMAETDVTGAEVCIGEVIGDFYRTVAADDEALAGIEIGDVIVTRTEDDRPADLANGALVEVQLDVDGQVASLFLEFVFQRHGRALSQLSFSSFGGPFDRTGYALLVGQVAVNLATVG